MAKRIFNLMNNHLNKVMSTKIGYEDQAQNKYQEYNPYFSSLSATEQEEILVEFLDGRVVNKDQSNQSKRVKFEVRFGDYKNGGGYGYNNFTVPYNLEEDATIWALERDTTLTMWNSLKDFSKRNMQNIGKICKDNNNFLKYSREKPHKFIDSKKKLSTDINELIKDIEDIYKDIHIPQLYRTEIDIELIKTNNYFVNSEGSEIFLSKNINLIYLLVSAVDTKGRLIPHSNTMYWLDNSPRPNKELIHQTFEKLTKELMEIVKAPFIKSDTYPCILDGLNHGVFWHEVIGHGLEGHRLGKTSEDSESIFAQRIGTKVAADFISLYDDPTIKGQSGSYLYDSEGIPSQRVCLIKNGILKNYLHSRESAGKIGINSNGHGRSDVSRKPCPRMSNLIIKSTNEHSSEELKELLIKEIVDQGVEYGLIAQGIEGGYTIPEESNFCTFPKMLYRVDKKGNTKLVRGLNITGTPFTALKNLIATGNDYIWSPGFCGAESGYVPASEFAPQALMKSLEFGKISHDDYTIIPKSIF